MVHLAAPAISQPRKHRALNPLKRKGAGAEAQKGTSGHGEGFLLLGPGLLLLREALWGLLLPSARSRCWRRVPKEQHQEQRDGARKLQDLLKTNLKRGSINQARK